MKEYFNQFNKQVEERLPKRWLTFNKSTCIPDLTNFIKKLIIYILIETSNHLAILRVHAFSGLSETRANPHGILKDRKSATFDTH